MAVNQQVAWLIAYDIRDPRRLGRLHRFLRSRAVPLQYSVFTRRASAAQMGMLARDIEEHIDPRQDDVRIYRIPEPALVTTWGRCMLPDDILLLDATSGQVLGTATRRTSGDEARR